MQVEEVGHPVGDTGDRRADRRPGSGRIVGRLRQTEERVLVVHRTDEHPGPAAVPLAQPCPGVSRVLQCVPGDLEEQPLLRIHRGRVARRDTEEERVEHRDVVEEAADHQVVGPTRSAPVGRQCGDGVAAVDQVAPEAIQVRRLGVPAGDADDGDPLVGRHRRDRSRYRRGPPLAQRGEFRRDAGEVGLREEERARYLAEVGGQPHVQRDDERRRQAVLLQRYPRIQPFQRDAGHLGVDPPDVVLHRGAGLLHRHRDGLRHRRGWRRPEPVPLGRERVSRQRYPSHRARRPVP